MCKWARKVLRPAWLIPTLTRMDSGIDEVLGVYTKSQIMPLTREVLAYWEIVARACELTQACSIVDFGDMDVWLG